MTEQQEECTKKPACELRRVHLFDELRFLKRQQWAVATAVITLLGALFALQHSLQATWVAFAVVVTLIATLGSSFLEMLQKSIRDHAA